jgi:hypothetical protein
MIMNLRNPDDFYAKYLSDFRSDEGPYLIHLSWDNTHSSLWTPLNIAYLIKLGFINGFLPECEYHIGNRKKLDLCWQSSSNHLELAVEQEWAAGKDDDDLFKLLDSDAYLKVFVTAIHYQSWINLGFEQSLAKKLTKNPDQHSSSYLIMNISTYPEKRPYSGLQLDGFAITFMGNIHSLPTKRFESKYTNGYST